MGLCEKHLHKAEDPAGYAKLANEGILLGYPVKIKGQTHRPDNNISYHSSIKFFDPAKDHPHEVHQLAQHLPLNSPDAKNTQIEPGQFKDRLGNDVYVLKMKGNSAEKIKEHNAKFAHMGFPSNYEYTPHISVDKATHDRIKASGAKTAHEAGIEFGPAELRKGPKTLKVYRHEPDTTEPKVPDHGDFTSKVKAPVTKAENTLGQEPLMKPYFSEAQRRWAHTATGKEALGGEAGVHEWDEATKGKKLPERVGKSEDDGQQRYHIHRNGIKITDKPLTMVEIKTATGKTPKDIEKNPNFRVVPHYREIKRSESEIKSLIKKEHDLHSRFSKAFALTGDTLKKYIEDNKDLQKALEGK